MKQSCIQSRMILPRYFYFHVLSDCVPTNMAKTRITSFILSLDQNQPCWHALAFCYRNIDLGRNFVPSQFLSGICHVSQQELRIHASVYHVFNHKMLIALAAGLHQLESLSFPGFLAASHASPSTLLSPLKGFFHFPNLRTLHLPRTFLSKEDMQLVFDFCPSLVEAHVIPQAGYVSIEHDRLEALSVGSMGIQCASLQVHAPGLKALEVKGIKQVNATISPHLENLVIKEALNNNSFSIDISPLPTELRHLYVDSKFYSFIFLIEVIGLVSANGNSLCSLELLSSENPCVDDDRVRAEYMCELCTAVQKCVNVTRLALDAAMLCHVSSSCSRTSRDFRFPALSSLRLSVWDMEVFCAERRR